MQSVRKETTIEEVISTTAEGEIVVLIETRKTRYVKRGKGLRVVERERLKIEREFSAPHHQSIHQPECSLQCRDKP